LGPGLGYQKGTYKTYFSAPRAERIEGDTTVFDKGTYTTCEAARTIRTGRHCGGCAPSASSTKTTKK